MKKSKERITLGQRMDRLETIVIDGFKQVNTRLDRVESRLDYIVKANNLKDSPNK